ncbi:MAG: hypothetical protein K8W52_04420 [Deltaproteobacteria bacterium]|nr:hypothetical protein [Deltaproteobacteria bacterium]
MGSSLVVVAAFTLAISSIAACGAGPRAALLMARRWHGAFALALVGACAGIHPATGPSNTGDGAVQVKWEYAPQATRAQGGLLVDVALVVSIGGAQTRYPIGALDGTADWHVATATETCKVTNMFPRGTDITCGGTPAGHEFQAWLEGNVLIVASHEWIEDTREGDSVVEVTRIPLPAGATLGPLP